MERKVTKYLLDWKNSPYRKPLILQGARQVGKTYILLEFGKKHYKNVAYFNFETNLSYLVPLLSRIAGQTIIREKLRYGGWTEIGAAVCGVLHIDAAKMTQRVNQSCRIKCEKVLLNSGFSKTFYFLYKDGKFEKSI